MKNVTSQIVGFSLSWRGILAGAWLFTLAACGGGGGGSDNNTSHRLDVAVTGLGAITSQPVGIDCNSACNAVYGANSTVTLTATPASGQSFSAWGGACAATQAATCTVRMDAAKSVTAAFISNNGRQHSLSLSVSGNGTVTSQPAGINCASVCSSNFVENALITLTATPASGHLFSGWSGGCTGINATCSLRMSAATAVAATFAPSPNGGTAATYEALPGVSARTELLNQLNAQGARGYVFIGPYGYGPSPAETTEIVNLYLKESNATYGYEMLDAPASADQLLAQMNAQGERGFEFNGPFTSGMMYVKGGDTSKSYLYDVLVAPDTVAGFLNQANAKGAEGFYFMSGYVFVGTSTVIYNIYAKDSGGNARYEHRAQPAFDPSTSEEWMTQANTQGLSGYKFAGEYVFVGEALEEQRNRYLYIKDASQSSVFEWKALASHTSSASFITQANTEGVAGYRYWNPWIFFPNGKNDALSFAARELYFKATDCSGVLCRR